MAGGMPLAFTQEDFLVTAHHTEYNEGYVLTRVCLSVTGGGRVSQPTQLGGGVRSKSNWGVRSKSNWGGSGQSPTGGAISPAGGVRSKSNRGGSVQPGGVRSVQPGGVQSSRGGGQVSPAGGSASCALLRAVCLLRSRRRTFLF